MKTFRFQLKTILSDVLIYYIWNIWKKDSTRLSKALSATDHNSSGMRQYYQFHKVHQVFRGHKLYLETHVWDSFLFKMREKPPLFTIDKPLLESGSIIWNINNPMVRVFGRNLCGIPSSFWELESSFAFFNQPRSAHTTDTSERACVGIQSMERASLCTIVCSTIIILTFKSNTSYGVTWRMPHGPTWSILWQEYKTIEVRTISLTSNWLSTSQGQDFLIPDIIQGTTECFAEVDGEGRPVWIVSNICRFLGN